MPQYRRARLHGGTFFFSGRWSRIKREFTRVWLACGGREAKPTAGKRRERRRVPWQPRFWEHTIEDDDDYNRHFDYLHYIPKKHGLVERVSAWPHSSFHRWVCAGVDPPGWGGGSVTAVSADMEHSTGKP
ncbi:MAG: transposase [Planctomycetaceae bacterium]